MVTENVNISMCTAGRCSHTFEPSSNSSSSYDNVSVAAENVVGVGAARTCTTQTISELLIPRYREELIYVHIYCWSSEIVLSFVVLKNCF